MPEVIVFYRIIENINTSGAIVEEKTVEFGWKEITAIFCDKKEKKLKYFFCCR